jgi:hypothetical protein
LKSPVKNGGNHKQPEEKGEKGRKKSAVKFERPYYRVQDRVTYKFKEGNSAAVRRPKKIKAFMRQSLMSCDAA